MDDNRRHPLEELAASRILLPVGGLLGGLLIGAFRGWIGGADSLTTISLVLVGGVTGSILGMASVFLAVFPPTRRTFTTIRGLLLQVLVAAVASWYAVSLLGPILAGRPF